MLPGARNRRSTGSASTVDRTQIQQTSLLEKFQFGVTDPQYNPVCRGADGGALLLHGVTNPDQCSALNPAYTPNPNLQPGIVRYDLTRGGSPFLFRGRSEPGGLSDRASEASGATSKS